MKFKVQAYQEVSFNDKNTGEPITLHKLVILTNGGLCEVYAKKPYAVGDMVELEVVPGKGYKASVRVV